MREIGRLGGVASGRCRLDRIDAGTRRVIAIKAARARWSKGMETREKEAAYLEARQEGYEDAAGWRRRTRGGSKALVAAAEGSQPAGCDPFETIADRDELARALDFSDDPRARRFLECLGSPKFRRWMIGTIARHCDLTILELMAMRRNYYQSVAMDHAVSKLPEVVEDMMADARSRREACGCCRGSGSIAIAEESKPCPECQGTGTVRKPGDSDARKMALEAVGWIGKGRVLVNQAVVQNNFRTGAEFAQEMDQLEKRIALEQRSKES
jgi:hypothetical protein